MNFSQICLQSNACWRSGQEHWTEETRMRHPSLSRLFLSCIFIPWQLLQWLQTEPAFIALQMTSNANTTLHWQASFPASAWSSLPSRQLTRFQSGAQCHTWLTLMEILPMNLLLSVSWFCCLCLCLCDVLWMASVQIILHKYKLHCLVNNFNCVKLQVPIWMQNDESMTYYKQQCTLKTKYYKLDYCSGKFWQI